MRKLLPICALLMAASLQAQPAREPLAPITPFGLDAGDCTNETLKGTFGLTLSGTRPAPPTQPPGTIEQVIGIVIQTFNGDGTFSQVSTDKGSISGVATRSGSGTYLVNEDCTGTTTLNIQGLPFPIVNNFVLANHGKEIRAFVASPQAVMVSSIGTKQ
jgi:hypothetical protein